MIEVMGEENVLLSGVYNGLGQGFVLEQKRFVKLVDKVIEFWEKMG
jgi:hypothetical protein